MALRVAVVGAGWYGCHIGLALLSLGMEVTVFDGAGRVLDGASGHNQFRLHLGFHYARHHRTRVQSREGFDRFVARYPALSAEVRDNRYAVPTGSSLIDFTTYKLIMVSAGLDFVEMERADGLLVDIEGLIRTRERVLLTERARGYFSERLGGALALGTRVEALREAPGGVKVNGRTYDYAVDATWMQWDGGPGAAGVGRGGGQRGRHVVEYEPTVLFYYEAVGAEAPAVTLVDGPLCSVYPTEWAGVSTLSSVVHTPLGQFGTVGAAVARRDGVEAEELAARRRAMEAQIGVNMPSFCERFRFAGVQLSVKTKPVGREGDRSCQVFQAGRVFSVLSGKIDTVFFAAERILELMEAARG